MAQFEMAFDTSIEVPELNERDIDTANSALAFMTPAERMQWASDTFGPGLHGTTSAGRDAAFFWDNIDRSGRDIGLTFVNTGFLHPDTLGFRDALKTRYPNQRLYECGPTEEQQAEIAAARLWEHDEDEFMRITKIEPLARLHKQLGVTAMVSAIHRDQTPHRAGLDFLVARKDGYRVHPFLDWTKDGIRSYIAENRLPSNPNPMLADGIEHRRIIYSEGEVSLLGITECGLHVVDGKLVRAPKPAED